MAIYLGRRLLAASSSLPEDWDRPNRPVTTEVDCPLFGLAPDGVYQARRVTPPAGELLPHRFTLTRVTEVTQAVYFLLHYP